MSEVKDSDIIWRFMSLSSFERMLNDKAIYFHNIPGYAGSDPFEGSYSWGNGSKDFMDFHKSECSKKGGGLPWQSWMLTQFLDHELYRRRSYVSCWYRSEHESEAMWRLYCNQELDNAVTIKTTVKKLKEELRRNTQYSLLFNEVQYQRDYHWKSRHMDTDLMFAKRKSFEHEKEFRALLQIPDSDDVYLGNQPKGQHVKVDFGNLIEEVRLSPTFNYQKYKLRFDELTQQYDFQIFKSEIEPESPYSGDIKIAYQGAPRNLKEVQEFLKNKKLGREAEVIEPVNPRKVKVIRYSSTSVTEFIIELKTRK
ncbi:hypothetical protein [Nafulsella turpanensis]|uniref:hypothetical protein n=1 Tax=Nafulsella turpanensis TaxID=1265690 RepID=UPI000346D48F|nr:hypothetical protein [Nafulsella turpanensis]